MMKKIFCTHRNLKIEATACNGTLLFVEDLVIEVTAEMPKILNWRNCSKIYA